MWPTGDNKRNDPSGRTCAPKDTGRGYGTKLLKLRAEVVPFSGRLCDLPLNAFEDRRRLGDEVVHIGVARQQDDDVIDAAVAVGAGEQRRSRLDALPARRKGEAQLPENARGSGQR